ncbi:branched-chain amino acid ABC transporter [Fulvivirga imtechensis AK7]|uniref:Branched-chain amino acid ABC transporter n=1 Tax=Fulvivirga imtechensis AK7 TaxID=1237149 RepID=L8JL34_9BACT|nr:ABC transporter substrate-binding protein [Fulvivirga imtechensis]ELR69515.1 branched-chain amino acid ABC transporter [Fulvivirga imtechensis AK7]
MTYVGKWLMTITASISLTANAFAQQQERYLEFSLEELSAVDVVKPLLPLDVDSSAIISGNTVNLGYLLPMAGYPDFTKELINSAQLAIEEINKQGGVSGKKLFLVPADIGATEEFIVKRANRLIDNYNTHLFLGPTSSDGLINLSDQLLPKKDFMIVSPTATSPAVSALQDRGLIFRTCPSDAVQGKQAAAFCYSDLGSQKAAVLYHDNFYGRTLQETFAREFEEAGGMILNAVRINPHINIDDYDMGDKLDSLLMGKPDVIYVISLAKSFSAISHQMARKKVFSDGYRPVIVMSDGATGEDLAQMGNLEVLNGMYGFYLPFTGNEKFAAKYEQKYAQKPLSLAAEYTYDIVYLMALAVMNANSTDPLLVSLHLQMVATKGLPVTSENFSQAREFINSGKDVNYEGITGKLDFDRNGDVNERSFSRWQLVDGEIIYIDK